MYRSHLNGYMKKGATMASGSILASINGDASQKPSFTGISGKKHEYEDEVPQDASIDSYV